MRRQFILLIVAFLTGMTITAKAQVSLDQPLPIDPNIRIGVLENGLTYYIRHNAEPRERASFYIIQNVGALLEADNQNGLAHFLEHMAFNGTQNFEGKGILNTLEKHGVAFGRNINAYTSFSETVYNLSDVPTTKPGLVDTCLLVLHDWSDFLLLTEEEIDAERGVITEEWRTRRNAAFRLRNQWFPVVFEGSAYAKRDVIGDTTVIRYHKPETLRKFYHDWYRTDLQAIAIVGDIDVDAVEAKVKSLFSQIKANENPLPRPPYTIPAHTDTRFVVATDVEATQSQINIYIRQENNDEKVKTFNDERESYIQALYNTMTQQRIQELLQKGTPPFVNGYTQRGGFVRGYDVYSFGAAANPNKEDVALEAIAIETERIRRHGFAQGELDRARTNLLTNMQNQYMQRDKISNESYCSSIVDHFLTKASLMHIEFNYQLASMLMPQITVEEVSAKAKEWINTNNRSIVITGPSNDKHLTKEEALAILAKVDKMEIAPYEDKQVASNLIEGELKGSKVKKTKQIAELDAVEWTLDNNVKVVFRKADFEKDEVTLEAFSFGGYSLLGDEFIPAASMSGSLIGAYGVGNFSATDLDKALTGKKVSVSPIISDVTEGFKGSTTPKDFETMLQLVYLYFEKPRFDAEAHAALMQRYDAYLANMQKDPRKIMQDSIALITTNYSKRTRNLDTQFIQEVKLDLVEKVYRDRIKDAEDFTFVIVGNIDEATVKPLVEKYIGSLTNDKRKETFRDHKVWMPKGETQKEIELVLTVPKTTVNVQYLAAMDFTPKNYLAIDVLRGILRLRYTETIREKEGGTYGVGVGGMATPYPTSQMSVALNFDCDPAKAEHLKSVAYREIETIINEGPTEVDFDKTIKNLLKDREQQSQHNSFYLRALFNMYYRNTNTADPANFENVLNAMTREDIQKFAKEFFAKADKVDMVFKPKAE
jgi:zinc protease